MAPDNANSPGTAPGNADLAETAPDSIKPSGRAPGYYSAEYEGKDANGASFLVCGTNGRLDRIYADGTVENIPLPVSGRDLTQVLISPDITLVSGFSGALVYSRDGKSFIPCDGVGNSDILCITVFRDKYYASTGDGGILISADGVSWSVGAQLTDKPIIAVAADDICIMAVTGDTDIFISEDGENWEMQNYNEIYYGLSIELAFLNLVNLQDIFFLIGYPLEEPDVPNVMLSHSGGEVWSTLMSREINNRPPSDFYPLAVNAVRHFGGALLAACDQGRILAYTDCPTCNTITEVTSSDLRAIAVSDDRVLVVGDDFEFKILSAEDLPQI